MARGSNKSRNWLLAKKEENDHFKFCIHKARVSDVHIEQGTVNVDFEDIPYSTQVNFPLLGLSMPPKQNETDRNESRASWGRYIPQKGDMLNIGFAPNGDAYALSYNVIFYQGFDYKDTTRESVGGIGWGEASAKQLKPGDWDFKSSRGSFMYLGDKAQLRSGPHSINLNKGTGEALIKSSLIFGKYGAGSESRQGEARRKILPTDPSETAIYNLTVQVAQESTDIVRSGFPQIELARTSMGDVVDELTFQVMVSTLGGTVIRRYEAVKDPTGLIDVYSKKVDNLGNYGVEAPTALLFQWTTPAASWTISNISTSFTSSATFGITSPSITLTAPTSIVLDSINVQLGGLSAVDFLIKGTTFNTMFSSFLTAVTAATSVVGSSAQNAAALAAIGVAATALNANLASSLSVKVKTE